MTFGSNNCGFSGGQIRPIVNTLESALALIASVRNQTKKQLEAVAQQASFPSQSILPVEILYFNSDGELQKVSLDDPFIKSVYVLGSQEEVYLTTTGSDVPITGARGMYIAGSTDAVALVSFVDEVERNVIYFSFYNTVTAEDMPELSGALSFDTQDIVLAVALDDGVEEPTALQRDLWVALQGNKSLRKFEISSETQDSEKPLEAKEVISLPLNFVGDVVALAVSGKRVFAVDQTLALFVYLGTLGVNAIWTNPVLGITDGSEIDSNLQLLVRGDELVFRPTSTSYSKLSVLALITG